VLRDPLLRDPFRRDPLLRDLFRCDPLLRDLFRRDPPIRDLFRRRWTAAPRANRPQRYLPLLISTITSSPQWLVQPQPTSQCHWLCPPIPVPGANADSVQCQ
jgi:hypothetical protein